MFDWTTWGLCIIHQIQLIRSPFLDFAMKLITVMGNEGFYLMALPILFWCWDREIGVRLGVLLLLSALLNLDLKHFFHLPRPFIKDPTVQVIMAYDYSFPSGHAQVAMVFWGFIAYLKKKNLYTAAAVFMILIIGFSRVYLGVHYPMDVLGGWGIGFITLLLFIVFEKKIVSILMKQPLYGRYLFVVFVPLILAALYPHMQAWVIAATMIGLGIGYLLNRRFLSNRLNRSFKCIALRFLFGLFVVMVVFAGLRSILPTEPSPFYPACRLFRYFLTGLFISFIIPYFFERLKI
jgi:membrane-associated phospholipid phosphatase